MLSATFSNMTAEEMYRATGTLSREKIEELLDAEAKLTQVKNIEGHLVDAHQFPNEDFLAGVTDKVRQVFERVHGENKKDLLHVIEMLDDIGMCTLNASQYGREELKQALDVVRAK